MKVLRWPSYGRERGPGPSEGRRRALPNAVFLADEGYSDQIAAGLQRRNRNGTPSPKVSIQAIYLQMAAAREFGQEKFDLLDRLTVPMRHPDGETAMLSQQTEVTSHFTSPPFHMMSCAKADRTARILSSYEVLGSKSTFVLRAAQSSSWHRTRRYTLHIWILSVRRCS